MIIGMIKPQHNEHQTRNRKVVGSNPTSGSISAGQRVYSAFLPRALLASLIIL